MTATLGFWAILGALWALIIAFWLYTRAATERHDWVCGELSRLRERLTRLDRLS